MKSLFPILIVSFGSLAFAKEFKLNDPAILGRYTLAVPDPQSRFETMQIRFNPDKKIVLYSEDQDQEYELSAADSKHVVYDGKDEPNCDGDEEACYFDSHTVIKLLTTRDSSGKEIPQIVLTATSVNAFDENDTGTDENFVFNWNPNPVNSETVACRKVVSAKVIEDLNKKVADDCVQEYIQTSKDDSQSVYVGFRCDHTGKFRYTVFTKTEGDSCRVLTMSSKNQQ